MLQAPLPSALRAAAQRVRSQRHTAVCASGLGPVVPSGLTEGQQARRVSLLPTPHHEQSLSLSQQFDVPDAVYVVEGVPGMTKVVLRNPCGRRARTANRRLVARP